MNYKSICLENDGEVAKVTLCGASGNALSIEMLEDLYQMVQDVEKEQDIHFVQITSDALGIFSSGLDLNGLYVPSSVSETAEGVIKAVNIVRKICQAIVESSKIYISILNGAAIGSAVSLALACDIRVASESAWVWLPDPQYGGVPEDGCIDLILYKASAAVAANVLLSNERFSAKSLEQWGLVMRVIHRDKLPQYTKHMMGKLVKLNYWTLRKVKERINEELRIVAADETLKIALLDEGIQQRLIKYLGSR